MSPQNQIYNCINYNGNYTQNEIEYKFKMNQNIIKIA